MVAVAIIGIGCKFPGGIEDAESFWEFILRKGDAVTDIPQDRWDADKYYDPDPDAPGRMYTRRGSFLTHRFQRFDPDFFGISRREAVILDPQQRLLLEIAWEAMDDAGIAGKVAGENVGAFIGSFTNDNAVGRASTRKIEYINNFAAFSASQTLLANRLSFTFNLTGPSMAVDTACSSSLVATHLAVRAITSGECDVALAGGSSVIFQPETFITMCKGRFLAADGRSKSFEANADGYGRGEGIGVVVLKNYEQALRDGDRVYAVIRGSGVNQDGRTIALPVPNPVSQQRLAESVIKEAGIDPAHVGYVEAHGTGTGVGDPLELTALGQAYSLADGRTDPLLIGSVKNNFGHTEAAAGVAGLIKAALTVQRRTVAPQAYFNNPNPEIPFDALRIRIPTEVEQYPDLGKPALVAVNSFGYGGTNAHVLVEEAPAPVEDRSPARDSVRIFPISARSGAALHNAARDYAELLRSDTSDENAQRLKTAITGRRAHHFLRKGLVYDDATDLLEQLSAYAESDEKAPQRTLVEGISDPVFVFSGMGPQWWAMGRSLLEGPGAFRDTAAEIDAAFYAISGWSVVDELLRSEEESRISRTEIAQPANFVVQAALAKHLEQFGVRPVAVVGHSVGEVTSAYVSGALSLHDAATVAFQRSRLQAKTAGAGGMLAVGLTEEDAQQRVERFDGAVSVAAINGSATVTLAGDQDALNTLRDELAEQGAFARVLRVEVPYHSHLMDPILDELGEALTGLVPRPAQIPVYSTVTGEKIGGEEFADPAYWRKNVRQPVLFANAVDTLIAGRYRTFVEVGPHPVLSGNIREGFIRHSATGAAIPTLHREKDAERAVLESVAELYAAGSIDVPGEADLYRDGPIEHVDLPKYPWTREELWVEAEVTLRDRYGDSDRLALLGDRTGDLTPQWGLTLAPANLPWLRDHVVAGSILLPGAAYIDAALSAVRQRTGRSQAALDSVAFVAPLVVAEHDVPITRLVVDESTKRFTFNGRSGHSESWTKHAQGRLIETNVGSLTVDVPPEAEEDRLFSAEEIYQGLAAVGLSYGPAFQRIRSARVSGSTCVAQLESLNPDESGPTWPYTVHPTISDAAMQCVAILLAARPELLVAPMAHIPVSVERVRLYHDVPENPLAVVQVTSSQPLRANAYLVSPEGDVALALLGVTLQAVGVAPDPLKELDQYFYELKWEPADDEPQESPNSVAAARTANVVVELGDVAAAIAEGARRTASAEASVARLDTSAQQMAELTETFANVLRRDSFARVVVTVGANNTAEGNLHQFITVAKALTEALNEQRESNSNGASSAAPQVQVVIVTRNAFVAPGDHSLDITHAVLAGARRTLANEQESAQWFLVDLDEAVTADEAATEIGAVGARDELDEVVVRGDKRWTQRLRRSLSDLTAVWEEPARAADDEVAYEIQLPKSRLFKDLALRECGRSELGPREVEVRLEAIGLNYKDALKILGILTERELEGTYFGVKPGMESASVVARIGSEVHEVQVGDQMMVLDRTALGRYVTFDLDDDTPWIRFQKDDWFQPEDLDSLDLDLDVEDFDPLAVGSGLPYLTAIYAFRRLVGVKSGERVLVHGAAGGMGMAAVQLAAKMGAIVYATAGSEERRRAAVELGATEAFDSRSVGFVDDILRVTDGEGVDVIYNSLPGEVVDQNFAVAGEFCRIVEIGKANIFFGGAIELKPFNRNLAFYSVDMDRLMLRQPQLFQELLEETAKLLPSGEYELLPYTSFPIDDVVGAFEAVFRAAHMGRIVMDLRGQTPMLLPRKPDQAPIRPNSSYVITGGFGAFGLATARWLAGNGATHVVLVGRSGATSDEVRAQIEALRATGVDVREELFDIADYVHVHELVGKIEASQYPLRGVFHAAGVVHDQPFTDITLESLQKVLEPKITGALNLDNATREHSSELDWFVVYSSVSAIAGVVPQTSYGAANSALDAFAEWRRSRGLPALSVNWGAMAGGGMAQESEAVISYLDYLGVRFIDIESAPALMHQVTRLGLSHVAIMDADWERLPLTMPVACRSSRFAHLPEEAAAVSDEHAEFRAMLLMLAPEERGAVVTQVLAEQLGEVLGVEPDSIDPRGPIMDLGIDSLMAVEFGARAAKHLNIQVGALQFTPDLTLERVGARVAELVVQAATVEENERNAAKRNVTKAPVDEDGVQHGDDGTASAAEQEPSDPAAEPAYT